MGKAIADNVLAPDEFAELCLEASRESRPDEWLASRLADCHRRIDPDVAVRCPAAYGLPLAVARRLYQNGQPKANRGLLSAVQALPEDHLAYGIGAAGKDAWDLADWGMIGWLCFQLDAARARAEHPLGGEPDGTRESESESGGELESESEEEQEASGYGDPPPLPSGSTLSPVQELVSLAGRFDQILAALVERRAKRRWSLVVRGYLLSVPPSFLPPADLAAPQHSCTAASGSGADWPLLRHLVADAPKRWWVQPDLQAELGKSHSLFVRTLADARRLAPPELSAQGPAFDDMGEGPLADWPVSDLFDAFLRAEDAPEFYLPPAELPAEPDSPGETTAEARPRRWWERRGLGWAVGHVELVGAALLALALLIALLFLSMGW